MLKTKFQLLIKLKFSIFR